MYRHIYYIYIYMSYIVYNIYSYISNDSIWTLSHTLRYIIRTTRKNFVRKYRRWQNILLRVLIAATTGVKMRNVIVFRSFSLQDVSFWPVPSCFSFIVQSFLSRKCLNFTCTDIKNWNHIDIWSARNSDCDYVFNTAHWNSL